MSAHNDDEVEFIDLGGTEDEIDWLGEPDGEDRVEGGGDPLRLPAAAAHRRILASLLSLALVLGALGAAASTAYHRHRTDVLLADTLELAASSSAPSIPGLAQLAFTSVWHADPVEQVTIPVVNKSPDAITLLAGSLTEPGLRGSAEFRPVGAARVAPGGTGTLAGTVTAECAAEMSSVEIAFPGSSTVPQSARQQLGSLLVRARSAGGRVGLQTIYPETAVNTTADRICSQQGDDFSKISVMQASADPATHTITVGVNVTSNADVALDFASDADFSTQPEAPGLVLPQTFTAVGTPVGTLAPGHTVYLGFQVRIAHCSGSNTPAAENILLDVIFLWQEKLVLMETSTTAVQPLIAKACGLG